MSTFPQHFNPHFQLPFPVIITLLPSTPSSLFPPSLLTWGGRGHIPDFPPLHGNSYPLPPTPTNTRQRRTIPIMFFIIPLLPSFSGCGISVSAIHPPIRAPPPPNSLPPPESEGQLFFHDLSSLSTVTLPRIQVPSHSLLLYMSLFACGTIELHPATRTRITFLSSPFPSPHPSPRKHPPSHSSDFLCPHLHRQT